MDWFGLVRVWLWFSFLWVCVFVLLCCVSRVLVCLVWLCGVACEVMLFVLCRLGVFRL